MFVLKWCIAPQIRRMVLTMDALQAQLYGVLATQGLIWVLGHCPAMCGPLVVALRFHGLSGVLAYQTGKAVTYALLGALAGGVGGVAILALRSYAPWVLGLTAALMIGLGLRSLFSRGVVGAQVPGWLARAVQRWSAGAAASTSHGQVFCLGIILSLLPCAVVIWALGLAVASASPLHGALLMVGLVLLNTPILIAAHVLGAAAWLAGVRRRLRWLPALGLLVAGTWLGWLAFSVGAPGCRT
jgi:sulfite exporter TauE/SafE